MPSDYTKLCSDFLRQHFAAQLQIKLKASHAHELVAAFLGYGTRAALLSETKYPLDRLDEADVLIPDVPRLQARYADLEGLPPDMPDALKLATLVGEFLKESGEFGGEIWIYDSIESYVTEVLLIEEDHQVMEAISGAIAETNAYFDGYPDYEPGELLDEDDQIRIEVQGTYSGTSDEDKAYSGDTVGVGVTVTLLRVAGRRGFSKPEIDAGGAREDWLEEE